MIVNYNRLQSELEDARTKVADLEQTKTIVPEDYRKERERYTNLCYEVNKQSESLSGHLSGFTC